MHGSIRPFDSGRKRVTVQKVAPQVAPDFLWVMGVVKVLWPNKTAEELRHITGASIRTCKYWLAGVHVPHGRRLLKLLRTIRLTLEDRLRMVEQFELNLE